LKYLDFVNLNYKPKETDVVCVFNVEPEDVSIEEAAGAIAAESSIGTWTEKAPLEHGLSLQPKKNM